MQPQKVAIVIPTRNNLPNLELTVSSLLSSTDYPFRLIIVESDSNDGTAEYIDYMAKRYPKKIFAYHTPLEGSIKAMNFGAKQTEKDEDIYFTHDDMIFNRVFRRDWLAQMAHVAQQVNIGIVTTMRCGGISGPEYLEGFRWVGTWSMYVPRRTIDIIGLFDTDFQIGEDIDYTYRISKAGLNVAQVDFWFEHHQARTSPHTNQNEDIIKTNAERFRKKHKLGEFNEKSSS